MEEKTAILEQQGRKVRIRRKHAKTKTMKLNNINAAKINMRGVELEDVDQFTYLGSIVSKEGGTDQDIRPRIVKATAVFKTLRPIWTASAFSTKPKIKIFKSNVKSVLLHACETSRTTKAATHWLQTFINRCPRNVLKIKWRDKVTNEELWRRGGQEPGRRKL